jgi:hypothetical protein
MTVEERQLLNLNASTDIAIRRAHKLIDFMRLVCANEAVTAGVENTAEASAKGIYAESGRKKTNPPGMIQATPSESTKH